MDKGQHLRLLLRKKNINKVIALATDLTFHVSVQTEQSTTKDSTDTTGMWEEYEKTGISYDIQIGALVGVGEDDANTFEDIINGINDEEIAWSLSFVSGEQNRIYVDNVANGYGKLSNVNATGQNRQRASYTATLNGYGPYEVAE